MWIEEILAPDQIIITFDDDNFHLWNYNAFTDIPLYMDQEALFEQILSSWNMYCENLRK